MNVLLTGATGFIGSNIASYLIRYGHNVIATHRTNSTLEKCGETAKHIKWVNTDKNNWEKQIKKNLPDILIHSAWGGVDFNARNNWDIQLQNFRMSKKYFDLAKEIGVKKIIALGSQAEYGRHKNATSEISQLLPDDAYGAVKVLTTNFLRTKFDSSEVQWYWIRIFSLFGENENDNWLISTVINQLLENKTVALTACEQKCNYLYIGDFLKQLMLVINVENNQSGIYNLCNTENISQKELLLFLAKTMNKSIDLLKFGELSYRPNQNMFIHGDSQKFQNTFMPNLNQLVGIKEGLQKTIKYHIDKRQ